MSRSMVKKIHGAQHGIRLKKQYGQHFLRAQSVVDHMLSKVTLTPESSVFEIGCGDGFLTRSIQQHSFQRLWVFEIDPEWALYVCKHYPDKRMTIFEDNILDIDFCCFESHKPWTLLSNLPYQITFPILHKLQQHRDLLKEGVIMIQEEVAQKIVKTYGRGYGYPSLFFQHYFEWKLLEKVPPVAFYPPPKVESRLLYFKPRLILDPIEHEAGFWQFIKRCFGQPRRTLKNNLQQYHYDLSKIPESTLALRAQQMSKEDFLGIWHDLIPSSYL
jgi:16S rRNA (adenine1518-N6/adenine1519-N6)-dimethyltransferase